MKNYIFILVAMALYACNNDEPAVIYYQFTSDDLSYLYFNKNTPMLPRDCIAWDNDFI